MTFEEPRAPRPSEEPPPTKTALFEVEAEGFAEKIGGLIVLIVVATICALVLHWAGVI